MKLYNFLVLVLIFNISQSSVFCSQERARQLAMHNNDFDKVYTLPVHIQILGEQFQVLGEQFCSLVNVLSEISDQAEIDGYHWEPGYIVDGHYNEVAFGLIDFEDNASHRHQECELMIDVQRVSAEIVSFLIWGLRD